MSFRQALFVGASALIIALPASAQVKEGGLGAIDPWGIGFLDPGETSMPSGMWNASRAEDLLPLMRQARTNALTPAERILLRRVVLSPAERPEGVQADTLLGERTRIMYALGEAEAAAELMGQLKKPPRGMDAEAMAADLQLALGNQAIACGQVTGTAREGDYWARLRAVCAVLEENTSAAELAVEFAQNQGVNDPWLFSAVYAVSGDTQNRPPARFDSGLNLALSTKAELTPPLNAVSSSRPDLAAAMATRPSLPADLRVQAAGIAAQAGLLSAEDHRATYEALFTKSGYRPGSPIEIALSSMNNPAATTATRARSFSAALRTSADNAARFAAVSRLVKADLDELPQSSDTARQALMFARASLAAGDAEAAARWSGATEFEGVPLPDPFEAAWIDGLIILGGGDASPASIEVVTTRLIEAAEGQNRQRAAAKLFSLWTSFGIAPPSEARAIMNGQTSVAGQRLNPWNVMAVRAAAEADAAGEVVLQILGFTRGDPTQLDVTDLAVLIAALREIGADDAARILALEGTGYWKAAL